MHEWSLAQAVINGALEYAEKHGLKRAIKISIRKAWVKASY